MERVLCVWRDDIMPSGAWRGLATEGLDEALNVIRERSFLMPRRDVEEDPIYQQVIAYAVFRHGDSYLLTHRLKASSERRLRQQYSLGVGGHINAGDLDGRDAVAAGLWREWEEEVVYEGSTDLRLLGLLKEESSPVGRVHVGVVFLVSGDRPDITIRETHKLSGELLTLDEMRLHYLQMESWSQIIYDEITRRAEAR
jgi:predicted NUDIX family phosphoesterase